MDYSFLIIDGRKIENTSHFRPQSNTGTVCSQHSLRGLEAFLFFGVGKMPQLTGMPFSVYPKQIVDKESIIS
jgi:hypothetical protein